MAPTLQVFLLLVVALSARARPQDVSVPYDFSYGVNVFDTGDVKEHKETKSTEGRTDGEYRWLQPNGLYRVVRYYVEPGTGFVAEVSEEPGPDVPNYYTNSIIGDIGDAAISFPEAKSFNSVTSSSQLNSIRARPNTISRQPIRKQTPAIRTPRPSFVRQSFTSEESSSSEQSFNNQQSFSSQGSFSGGIIDGGVIDGGIIDGGFIDGGVIDGGIIDGGIIDGGIINGAFINGEFVPSPSFGTRSK